MTDLTDPKLAGRIAVADAYAAILARRNPGTSFVSARRAELAGPLPDGMTVVTLGGDSALQGAPAVDATDSREEESG